MSGEYFDVIIIGGGIVGTWIARELSRYTIKTCLIEKEYEVSFGVSKANSGIIHAGFHASNETLKGQLCTKGNNIYQKYKDELQIPFKQIGELVLIKHESEFAELEKLKAMAAINGVPGLEIIDQKRVRLLEPNVSDDVIGALFAPSAGVVNPYELVYLLVNNAQRNQVKFKTNEEVISIEERYLRTTKGRYSYKYIINAAGLYADRIANMVGLNDFTIKARKGQEYLLDKKCQGLINHIIFPLPSKTTKGTLIIPTLDGTIMVGPSAEEGYEKTDLGTTDEIFRKIFSHAKGMIPKVDPKYLISAFAGARPVATGEDFIIGPTKVKGFINAAGIQSPGLTAAPAIAEMVVGILKKEGLALEEKFNFIPTTNKFHKIRELDEKELAQLVDINPDYGNVVCRCEKVSKGEIKQAIANGAKTLDGIKFRTRAGMGRCQGGFCTFQTIDIISKELCISPLKVTKKGIGSEVLKEDIGNLDD